MRPPVKITIRDGRAGRDSEPGADGASGAVLFVVERAEPLDIGDKVRLSDGTDVFVLRDEEKLGPGNSSEQTVYVGNLGHPAAGSPSAN